MITKIKELKFEIIASIVVFSSLLFKYLGIWSYLVKDDFFKFEFLLVIVGLLTFLILLFTKATLKSFITALILAVVIGIVTILSTTLDFAMALIFALCFYKFDNSKNKFITIFFYCSIILFITTVLLNATGIIPSHNSTRIEDGITITRYSLGFTGTNAVYLSLVPIILSFLIKFKDTIVKNKKIILLVILFIIIQVVYELTLSRTGYITSMAMLIFIAFPILLKNKFSEFFFKYAPLFFLAFSIILALTFGNDYENIVNKTLSNRAVFWNNQITNGTLGIFYQAPTVGMPVDNIYLTTLYSYGIISFLFTTTLHIMTFKLLKKNYYIYLAIVIFSIYGIFENNILYYQNFIIALQLITLLKTKNKSLNIITETKEDLVSIIIPMYNARKTIQKCLDSVIEQTHKNIEVLIINDGSKDNSINIIKENYNDRRIKLINQDNSGVSSARNKGLDLAKGKYILFVDSDDYIDKDLIEKLLLLSKDNNLVVSPYKLEKKDKTNIYIRYQEEENNIKSIINGSMNGYIHGCLFQRDKIEHIRFDTNLIYMEDMKFLVQYTLKIKKINIAKNSYYHYLDNNEGICKDVTKVTKKITSFYKSLFDIQKLVLKENVKISNKIFVSKTIKLIESELSLLTEGKQYKEVLEDKVIQKIIKGLTKQKINIKQTIYIYLLINRNYKFLSKYYKLRKRIKKIIRRG